MKKVINLTVPKHIKRDTSRLEKHFILIENLKKIQTKSHSARKPKGDSRLTKSIFLSKKKTKCVPLVFLKNYPKILSKMLNISTQRKTRTHAPLFSSSFLTADKTALTSRISGKYSSAFHQCIC